MVCTLQVSDRVSSYIGEDVQQEQGNSIYHPTATPTHTCLHMPCCKDVHSDKFHLQTALRAAACTFKPGFARAGHRRTCWTYGYSDARDRAHQRHAHPMKLVSIMVNNMYSPTVQSWWVRAEEWQRSDHQQSVAIATTRRPNPSSTAY